MDAITTSSNFINSYAPNDDDALGSNNGLHYYVEGSSYVIDTFVASFQGSQASPMKGLGVL